MTEKLYSEQESIGINNNELLAEQAKQTEENFAHRS